MHNFLLTTDDFQEILSSLLLAELPYAARMQFTEGASLTPAFVPTTQLLPNLAEISSKVSAMFHTPTPHTLGACSLRQWAEALHEDWGNEKQDITFFTSGSTGEPTPATQAFANHEQEVTALAEIFHERKRVVSFVPRHHIYGFLFSILLPKALGVEVKWAVPIPTPGLTESLQKDDLIVAFPLFWEKLKEMKIQFSRDLYGVTSTGPCPAETIHALKQNGLKRIYEIYGSSETGGVGYRKDPTSGYTLLPFWARTDDESCLQRTNSNHGNQEYALQDILNWNDATTFTPMRRTDNAVQVAGINVYPSHVRKILLEHPSIADCAIRLMRPKEGTRLKALIILNDKDSDLTHLEFSIRKWAKSRLSPYELPAAWTFKDEISTNTLGKAQDW
ncbi:MAG: AMP-binding protein [Pseudodesulfovibrio sp.]|nr:AMP-binding protein [Pseudodesulfovibrio sp.]